MGGMQKYNLFFSFLLEIWYQNPIFNFSYQFSEFFDSTVL